MATASKSPGLAGVVGSALGLVFASYSSVDYAQHLDRRLHDVHCSLIPGLTGSGAEENPCRAAMYSAYAAVFRDRYWGGIPISLLAVGALRDGGARPLRLGPLDDSPVLVLRSPWRCGVAHSKFRAQ